MASLQIRDLPDDVYQALAARARREGRSLAQQALYELRKLAEVEARDRRKLVIGQLRQRAEEGAPPTVEDPVTLIREDRDA
jgi:plasmid stability protein